MNGLDLLIHLAKRETEAIQVELARIDAARQEAESSVRELDAIAERETEAAMQDSILGLGRFIDWHHRARRQRAALEQTVTELNRRESDARDVLRGAFAGQKRLEIARDQKIRELQTHMARRIERHSEDQYILSQVVRES